MYNSSNPSISGMQTPEEEELCSGFLYKSPFQSVVLRNQKSWKRRYFVLSKTPRSIYELKFFKDKNKNAKPIGEINLYLVSLILLCPESHPFWSWIQSNFRCSASCVLYMTTPNREYFFIGENSDDIDTWFKAITTALKTRPHTLMSSELQTDKINPECTENDDCNPDNFCEWQGQSA